MAEPTSLDILHEALMGVLKNEGKIEGGYVTGFVAMAEFIDETGAKGLMPIYAPGMTAWLANSLWRYGLEWDERAIEFSPAKEDEEE